MFVSSVLKKCANLINHDSSKQNGSVSKEQAEVFQNKTPENNLPSNPSADVTDNKEEWETHKKENIENQLIHNQKDLVADVENIAPFREDQNRKLQIQDVSVNDTFSVENSLYLEESYITPLNITDICDNFINALSISDGKQNVIQQENVSVRQDNYFGEVVQDDIKSFASEFLSTSETTVFEDETSDGDGIPTKMCNDVIKTPEHAGGSSVVMNFTFKDEQKTEYQQGNEVASCDNKNFHFPQNVSEVKPEQKLTDSKNDDIAYVESRAEVPDQNNTKDQIETSLPQFQNGECCLETVKQEVSEINIASVTAIENSISSPLRHQIQYENKPAGEVQSSPEEFNLTFEHAFEQTVILYDESTQKEPIGDDVNVPLGSEKKNSMSEQELEQNFMSVSNGVNDRDSSSHCDTELQTKQQENESSSDNVGSFPSSTSREINLAPELEQKDAIIYGVVENNTSVCDSREQENMDSEKRIDIVQEETVLNVISPEKNDICNNISTGELASEGPHQENFSRNINDEKGDDVGGIEQYPSPVVEEGFKQEGNKIYDNIQNDSFMCDNKEQKIVNSEKKVDIVQEKTILNVVSIGELSAEGAETHQNDFPSNINNEKGDNIDDIQPYSTPVTEENLAIEGNIYCNNVETNMFICDSKQQENVDSEKQADTVQEKSVLNVVLPEKNDWPVAKHIVHQEDSSNNAQNKKRENVDDIEKYTTSVVEQDLVQGKNKICGNVENSMFISGSKEQKNENSGKQGEIVQDKTIFNVNTVELPSKENFADPDVLDVINEDGVEAIQEEINAELKLQLQASQQSNAILELQLRQKENVILKSQEDVLRKDEAHSQEIKQLKRKLEEQCIVKDNTEAKELQEALKSVKNRETKLLSELNFLKNKEQNYRKIMNEYENTIGTQVNQLKNLSEEHETVKRHLANLELAFSDVHQKYERSKKIIDGYKCNEVTLRQTLITSEESVIKSEQKYESLKSHAKAQIEKSNQALHAMRQQSEAEIHKLSAIIKRLEITNASLKDSLGQKKKECIALGALCDEVTGKV